MVHDYRGLKTGTGLGTLTHPSNRWLLGSRVYKALQKLVPLLFFP